MTSIFWHRRDLRIDDNAGLYYSLKESHNVQPIFIFDLEILAQLKKNDTRVQFIHQALQRLKGEYQKLNTDLKVYYGNPLSVWKQIVQEENIDAVYTNHDYEPYAISRDKDVKAYLERENISFKTFKDQAIFEKDEVTKADGLPYTVFTPYSRKWKEKLNEFYLESYSVQNHQSNFKKIDPTDLIGLEEMGFSSSDFKFPKPNLDLEILRKYAEQRDFPSRNGTSRLSVHLRFGTVSIRKLARIGLVENEKWLNELIWRDFYMMILHHFPHVVKSAFRPKYDRIVWRNNEKEFLQWCKGETGYPIVDAGMRELNQTGFMHNRVRMIVASFLTKHLLIDWRWGEAYFAEKLMDFELSSNNGGWQWASGSGCDAAPYFRVFNPELQTKKFDSNFEYIRKWVPEFEDPFSYSQPIVEHKMARLRAIETYKRHLS